MHQRIHALLHQLFGTGIDRGGGLIQNHHRRICHRRPGDGNQLPLTLGELGAVAGQMGVVTLRQAGDEIVGIGGLGGGDALFIGGIQLAVTDVFHNGAGEQIHILQNNAQASTQIGLFDLVDVDAVVADLAIGNIIEAVDQVGDGGLTGTVMDNIRYGKLDATDEECIHAAKLANAHDFITRLPEGYNTELTNNGASLSQGQRQLIAIARAAVADPPVMILDEATSSIDTRTEALVQKGMDALMHGRTTFVIAHRLSTVMNSDCIMVLDHGHIIERGTHEDLIAQKGTYYQLYTGAFELE